MSLMGFRMRAAISLFGLFLLWQPVTLLAEMGPLSPSQKRWDKRYNGEHYVYGVAPVTFLKEQIKKIPRGKALCLAAGEGRNAVYLAQQGFEVVAVDISPKGLEKGRKLAQKLGVEIKTVVADLRKYDMGRAQYDLITDFYYYDPALFGRIMTALKPGGFFVFQNFSIDQPNTNRFGPRNPAYLVKPNEILNYFDQYRIRYYEDTVIDLDEGMHRGRGAVIRLMVENSAAE